MENYDDIINLPHYEPKHHPRMSMWNRAAQFAPFAALTGYNAAIQDAEIDYISQEKPWNDKERHATAVISGFLINTFKSVDKDSDNCGIIVIFAPRIYITNI